MILLDGSSLTIDQLMAIADRGEAVALAPAAVAQVQAARAVVDRTAGGADPVYGVNTGFGSFADVRIAPDALTALQLNLLRSHAAGVGEPLSIRAVRATMPLRANVLAKGFSGIRLQTLDALVALLNAGIHPRVPSRGSMGASGDLAPLAHLALVLIGEGQAFDATTLTAAHAEPAGRFDPDDLAVVAASAVDAPWISGAEALRRAGLSPVTLAPKGSP